VATGGVGAVLSIAIAGAFWVAILIIPRLARVLGIILAYAIHALIGRRKSGIAGDVHQHMLQREAAIREETRLDAVRTRAEDAKWATFYARAGMKPYRTQPVTTDDDDVQ
jgi:hypothetical protein